MAKQNYMQPHSLAEIEKSYPYQVNVAFLNILKPENQELMKYFGVVAIPTQVLLNSHGLEIFRHTGYISARELSVKFSLNE